MSEMEGCDHGYFIKGSCMNCHGPDLRALALELREALRRTEWVNGKSCHECGRLATCNEGHSPSCIVGRALKNAEVLG